MLTQLRTTAWRFVQTAMSAVGLRVGVEEPPHSVQRLADGAEIRQYGPRIAAQTNVAANEEAARAVGFRRLASYIFGANHRSDRIVMTAPVAQQTIGDGGQKIDMTAPVAQIGEGADWIIRFYMPSRWTLETLPTPDDGRVELVAVAPETIAVLRFSGDRSPDSVAAQTVRLRDILRDYGFEAVGEAAAWFYDPPWTLPFRRRNEIAIPVDGC